MDRAQKRELVNELSDIFSNAGSVVVAHYSGTSVADMTELRVKMKQEGARIKVAKNRLVKLALKDTEVEHISDLFQGPSAFAYSEDPISASKIAIEFAKKHDSFVVLGGAMGSTNLDADGVKSLASMPSLDELRGKILGMLSTPASRIAQVVNAPAGQVARVIQAKSEQAS